MRILLTAAAGSVGSHLVDRFLREGHGDWPGLDCARCRFALTGAIGGGGQA